MKTFKEGDYVKKIIHKDKTEGGNLLIFKQTDIIKRVETLLKELCPNNDRQ